MMSWWKLHVSAKKIEKRSQIEVNLNIRANN